MTGWDKLYNYCENLDKDKSWIMPSIDEDSLIYLNYRLISTNSLSNLYVGRKFATRTPIHDSYMRIINGVSHGSRGYNSKDDMSNFYVRCVRRTGLK